MGQVTTVRKENTQEPEIKKYFKNHKDFSLKTILY